jgi:hypothetical protein
MLGMLFPLFLQLSVIHAILSLILGRTSRIRRRGRLVCDEFRTVCEDVAGEEDDV